MALPFTPAQLLANVPQTTQDPCQATRLAWLAFPKAIYNFFKYAISADGTSLTAAFLNLIWDIGDYKYSANGNLDTNNASSKWLLCDGRTVSQTDFAALYALLGTTFGPAAAGTFTLPSFRGKFPLVESGTHVPGGTGGEETHILTLAETPAHAHNTTVPIVTGAGTDQGVVTEGSIGSTSFNTDSRGGGGAHNTMPPYLVGGFMYIKT